VIEKNISHMVPTWRNKQFMHGPPKKINNSHVLGVWLYADSHEDKLVEIKTSHNTAGIPCITLGYRSVGGATLFTIYSIVAECN
jgi:hypothetical protein